MSIEREIMPVGCGIGEVTKLVRGVRYTGVWVEEDLGGNNTIIHYLLIANSISMNLRIGMRVKINLEICV